MCQTGVAVSVLPPPATEKAFCWEKIAIPVLAEAAHDSGELFLRR